MHSISTDVQLAQYFSRPLAEAYYEAVEFSAALPSHSLVKYRSVLEALADRQFLKSGLVTRSDLSLFEKINELADGRVFTIGLKNRFHRIRTLCNPGAHVPVEIGTSEQENAALANERLRQSAEEVRGSLLFVMEHFYRAETDFEGPLDYSRVEIPDQEWKSILFDAATKDDPNAKYKAGLICEAELERRQVEFSGLIVPDGLSQTFDFLKKLAATYFQAAALGKHNIDAMYRYARYVEQGKIDRERSDEAIQMIATAAAEGHAEACDYYAAILYEQGKEYATAERLWRFAARNNVPRSYMCLWTLYSEGKAFPPDHSKALDFLAEGVAQDCHECLFALGRCYYDGTGVEKNTEKATELLQKSSELGNGYARFYLRMEVQGGRNYVADEMYKIGKMLEAWPSDTPSVGAAKPDVYAPCPCGSGKKRKWCCGLPRNSNNGKRSLLGYPAPK